MLGMLTTTVEIPHYSLLLFSLRHPLSASHGISRKKMYETFDCSAKQDRLEVRNLPRCQQTVILLTPQRERQSPPPSSSTQQAFPGLHVMCARDKFDSSCVIIAVRSDLLLFGKSSIIAFLCWTRAWVLERSFHKSSFQQKLVMNMNVILHILWHYRNSKLYKNRYRNTTMVLAEYRSLGTTH